LRIVPASCIATSDAQALELLAGTGQPRRDVLERPVAQRAQQPELDRTRQQRGVGRSPARGQLVGAEHLGRVLGVGLGDGAQEAQRLLGGARRRVDQPPDRLEVEALALHLADQLDAVQMGLAVVAGAAAHLGRRQQAARLMRPDVADGHPRALGELVDGQAAILDRALGCLRDIGHGSILPRLM
jgi:hypothetical protein